MSTRLEWETSNVQTSARKGLITVGLFTILVLSLYLVQQGRGFNRNAVLMVPPGFQLLADVDLGAQQYDGDPVAGFTLQETAVVRIYYRIPNLDTDYFDLRLVGPADSESYLILHSEDFRTDGNGSGLWEQPLAAGVYRLELNAQQTQGVLSIYWTYQ